MGKEHRIRVELSKLRFFAFHGLYEEEKKTGNEFELDVSVSFQTTDGIIDKLSDTVNYVRLHGIIAELMDHPEKLLETVAMKLAEKIHDEFAHARLVDIRITKLHPPIRGFEGHVAVSYQKEF